MNISKENPILEIKVISVKSMYKSFNPYRSETSLMVWIRSSIFCINSFYLFNLFFDILHALNCMLPMHCILFDIPRKAFFLYNVFLFKVLKIHLVFFLKLFVCQLVQNKPFFIFAKNRFLDFFFGKNISNFHLSHLPFYLFYLLPSTIAISSGVSLPLLLFPLYQERTSS